MSARTFALLVVAFALGGCNLDGLFTHPIRSAAMTDDARAEGAGTPQAALLDPEVGLANVSGQTRFPRSDPSSIRVLPGGREHLGDYLVLGLVEGGATNGIGRSPDYLEELRAAAAALGADTVLDVHTDGFCLLGLAARRRAEAATARPSRPPPPVTGGAT